MDKKDKKEYLVFISYAHADVRSNPKSEAIVDRIRNAIIDGLIDGLKENSECEPKIFFDVESIAWGDGWAEKIRTSLDEAKIFVYLLSPNYLRSDYCHREKLWWAGKEMRMGRLNKAVRPILYVRLPNNDELDDDMRRLLEELNIIQMDVNNNEPFFTDLDRDGIDDKILEARLEQIKTGVAILCSQEDIAQASLCTISSLSHYFVGRIKELNEIKLKCQEPNKKIVVISGLPGIGKSELAIAYAHAYAEEYPQGRFLIPMEGVTGWKDAICAMVGKFKQVYQENNDFEEFERKPKEEQYDIAWNWLKARAKNGRLLLLLDNLEEGNLNLLDRSDNWKIPTREELFNITIIATVRKTTTPPNDSLVWCNYEVGALSMNDAIQLFCEIGKNVFPFAKLPMADGKFIKANVDRIAQKDAAEYQALAAEYQALKDIIRLLQYHPWALEIVAGFMANNADYPFTEELKDLQKAPSVVAGDGERHSPWNNPKELLTPTIDRLKNWNDVDENLGDHILYLAKAASFFSPEDIPQEVLEGLWDQCFENKVIEWDGGRRKALTKILALKELKAHHLLTGDNGTLKMHRLVRAVLQEPELLPKSEKMDILVELVEYLDASLKERSLPAGLLKAWCGWADAALEIEELQTNEEFLFTIRALADQCQDVDLYRDAEILLQKILNLTGWESLSDELRAAVLNTFAVLHHDLNRFKEAEKEYRSALKIREQLAKKDAAKYNAALAQTLNNLGVLHSDLNRFKKAEKEYRSALKIYERLAGENPAKYSAVLAGVLNNLAVLHSDLDRNKEAEDEYRSALKIYKQLAKKDAAKYNADLAQTLNNLGVLHSDLNRNEEAEKEYRRSLEIYEGYAQKNPLYNDDVVETLNNFVILLRETNHLADAISEVKRVLALYERLAGENPDGYGSHLEKIRYLLDSLQE